MAASNLERDVIKLHTVARGLGHGRPVLIDIETVRGIAREEVLEQHVPHVSIPAPRLDHEDLVPAVSVDVAVDDVLDRCSLTEGPDCAATGLVAPDALDEDVLRGGLDRHALVAVRDLDIVDPVILP